jgi:hypothetical protein
LDGKEVGGLLLIILVLKEKNPCPTLWFSCSRRFSSCSSEFNHQIAQFVIFMFLFFSFKTVG